MDDNVHTNRIPALATSAKGTLLVETGMRRQRLRVEVRLSGELMARYQNRYLDVALCEALAERSKPAATKPVRKDHNAGGKSKWMQGFFDSPRPPLWKGLKD